MIKKMSTVKRLKVMAIKNRSLYKKIMDKNTPIEFIYTPHCKDSKRVLVIHSSSIFSRENATKFKPIISKITSISLVKFSYSPENRSAFSLLLIGNSRKLNS